MDERSLKYVAEACGAEIRQGTADTMVKNVCTDSRKIKPGDLFFAIKGENFDGHDFVKEVAAKKAAAKKRAKTVRGTGAAPTGVYFGEQKSS